MSELDDRLRAAYRGRPRSGSSAPVSVETVQALAEGTYVGADREALLDAVLRDPDRAAEFHFLHAVAQQGRAAPTRRWRLGPWALAAAGALVLALGARIVLPPDEGGFRSAGERVVLHQPAEGSAAVAGEAVTFGWGKVDGATSYDLELAAPEGEVIARRSTTDTTVALAIPAGASRWWVIAQLPDGSTHRSPVREIRASR